MPEVSTAKVYVFGPFRLEVLERRLLRDGELVPLLGKAGERMQHDWPLTLPWLRESRHAWKVMEAFIRERCAALARSSSPEAA